MLHQLLEAVRDRLGRSAPPRKTANREQIALARTQWLETWTPQLTSKSQPLSAYRVVWDFIRTIDPDTAIVTHDAGSPRDQLLPFYVTTPAARLHRLGANRIGLARDSA